MCFSIHVWMNYLRILLRWGFRFSVSESDGDQECVLLKPADNATHCWFTAHDFESPAVKKHRMVGRNTIGICISQSSLRKQTNRRCLYIQRERNVWGEGLLLELVYVTVETNRSQALSSAS